MKRYLGVLLLFLVCLQASQQVFGAKIKRSSGAVAAEECPVSDLPEMCDLENPCDEIPSPCGKMECYPCPGCESYTCIPLKS